MKVKTNELKNMDDWQVKKLKEVTSIYDGTHQTPEYTTRGISFYSVENITNNDFKNIKYISESVYKEEIKKVKIEKDDILMTKIGDIGTSRIIDWDIKASFYVSLALIKKSNAFNSSFLNHFIHSNFFQQELWN